MPSNETTTGERPRNGPDGALSPEAIDAQRAQAAKRKAALAKGTGK